jgi:hypothetical protein
VGAEGHGTTSSSSANAGFSRTVRGGSPPLSSTTAWVVSSASPSGESGRRGEELRELEGLLDDMRSESGSMVTFCHSSCLPVLLPEDMGLATGGSSARARTALTPLKALAHPPFAGSPGLCHGRST